MKTYIHAFIAQYLVRSVESMLAGLSKAALRLEKSVAKYDDLADLHNAAAAKASAKAAAATEQADRAARVASRLKDLVA